MARKLIVGLGNYPPRYRYTRHNIGFLTVEEYARRHSLKWHKDLFRPYKTAQLDDAILLLPYTYMNNTGKAVVDFIREIGLEDILLICDDIALPWLRVRLRLKGSSGGHRGLESVFSVLGSNAIARLRMGVDRPSSHDVVEYVLEEFSEEQKRFLPGYLESAFAIIDKWIQDYDRERLMSEVNNADYVLKFIGGEDGTRL